ncbi:MAG: GAF domain-containing sensor histidine kinase [Anaerolineae bacterium]|nr:GAF domain-containing sensor histidine kinase [Anaerolineae bacterium]
MKNPGAKLAILKVEHLFQISEIVTKSPNWKLALDKTIQLLRTVFIFDNIVLYKQNPGGDGLDVMYARAIGRGRSGEADIAWGEELANKVSRQRKTIIEEPTNSAEENRIKRPFILGIPLLVSNHYLGTLIFIRFGGPPFAPSQIRLAEFVAHQVTLLIERNRLECDEEELQAQYKQVQLQQEFISTITHELRSPLGFIKGYTTTLLRPDTTWDEDTRFEFLQIIDRETDHMQELITNLLDSARLQAGLMEMNFQPIRIDALMSDLLVRTQLHNPRTVINLQVNQPLQPITGDPARLTQVFENLISNAIKYAPGSELLIKIEQDKAGTSILFKDYGPGISSEYLPLIFERFFRGPDQAMSSQGSGLGLFICKQIIQAHCGKIAAESDIGEGMVFHIFLPYDRSGKEWPA